jgi:hypothetical protein
MNDVMIEKYRELGETVTAINDAHSLIKELEAKRTKLHKELEKIEAEER